MMMSDLPLDLVEEILSRVPATSMKRLRSTCKRWNDLSKDQRFTEKHFRKAPKESMVLMLKEYKVFSMSINLNVSTPSSIEFQGALGLKDNHSNSEEVEITDVFHCDGLLLCSTNDNRLVVWNPSLGETRWIQRKAGSESSSRFTLGYIQNNNSCRTYKILRGPSYYYGNQRCEVYEFSSDSWRVLDDVVLDCFILHNGYSSGASSLKGNTYWLAKKDEHESILSFDFTAERLKHMCLPPFQNRGCVTLSVGREEQLSVLNWSYNNPSKREMWVTNKIDADQSELLWSKSFIVDSPIGCNCLKMFTSLLIDAEKKVSLCCSLEERNWGNLVYTIGENDEYYTGTPYTSRKGWLGNQKWRPVIFNYVPSLVQIKKAEKKTSK